MKALRRPRSDSCRCRLAARGEKVGAAKGTGVGAAGKSDSGCHVDRDAGSGPTSEARD